jgi:hypothetical protein
MNTTQTFQQQALEIRGEIRRFSTDSLVNQFFAYLQKTPHLLKDGQVSAPWVVLLAIDWALELSDNALQRDASCEDAHNILNRIWQIQHLTSTGGPDALLVQLRALLAPQITFQRSPQSMGFFFLRMKRIIDASPDHRDELKQVFLNLHKIDFDIFYAISFTILVMCIRQNLRAIMYSDILNFLTPHHSINDIALVLKILSSTLDQLKSRARDERTSKLPSERDYFKESIFLQTPFLRLDDCLLIIHPVVVLVGTSESVLRSLIRQNDASRRLFTKCFEEYVALVHQEFDVPMIRENELRDMYNRAGKGDQPVVDFLLADQSASILIDAKGIDPTNPHLSATSRYALTRRIRGQHLKAIEQIIDTIGVLSEIQPQQLNSIENRYGLVITHQDFFLGTSDRILTFIHSVERERIQKKAENLILFRNIHFMSIEQYEHLQMIVSQHHVSLKDFFEFVSESESRRETTKMIMDQYLAAFSEHVTGALAVPSGTPSLRAELDRIFEQILTTAEANNNYWRTRVPIYGDDGIREYLKAYTRLHNSIF